MVKGNVNLQTGRSICKGKSTVVLSGYYILYSIEYQRHVATTSFQRCCTLLVYIDIVKTLQSCGRHLEKETKVFPTCI